MATGAVRTLTAGDTTGAGLDQVVDALNTLFATGRLRIFDVVRDTSKKDRITGGNIVVRVLYEEVQVPPPPAPIRAGCTYKAVGFQGDFTAVQTAYETFFPNGTTNRVCKVIDLTDLENAAATPLRLLVVYTDEFDNNPLHGQLPEHLMLVRADEDILAGASGNITYLNPDGSPSVVSGRATNIHPTATADLNSVCYAIMDENSNLVNLLPSCCVAAPPAQAKFVGIDDSNQDLIYTTDAITTAAGVAAPPAAFSFSDTLLLNMNINSNDERIGAINLGGGTDYLSTDGGATWAAMGGGVPLAVNQSGGIGGRLDSSYTLFARENVSLFEPGVTPVLDSPIWFLDNSFAANFPLDLSAGVPGSMPVGFVYDLTFTAVAANSVGHTLVGYQNNPTPGAIVWNYASGSYTQATIPDNTAYPRAIAVDNGTGYYMQAGDLAGQPYVWLSTDDGATWSDVSVGLPGAVANCTPRRICVYLGVWYIALDDFANNQVLIIKSSDNGTSWSVDSTVTGTADCRGFAVNNNSSYFILASGTDSWYGQEQGGFINWQYPAQSPPLGKVISVQQLPQ